MGRGSSHAKIRVTQIQPPDAKQSHPVIYSIFLISTSLNSQHLNGENAEGVSFWLPCLPTKLSAHTQKRTAQQTYYNCTIIGSLMRVWRSPARAVFFPGEA